MPLTIAPLKAELGDGPRSSFVGRGTRVGGRQPRRMRQKRPGWRPQLASSSRSLVRPRQGRPRLRRRPPASPGIVTMTGARQPAGEGQPQALRVRNRTASPRSSWHALLHSCPSWVAEDCSIWRQKAPATGLDVLRRNSAAAALGLPNIHELGSLVSKNRGPTAAISQTTA